MPDYCCYTTDCHWWFMIESEASHVCLITSLICSWNLIFEGGFIGFKIMPNYLHVFFFSCFLLSFFLIPTSELHLDISVCKRDKQSRVLCHIPAKWGLIYRDMEIMKTVLLLLKSYLNTCLMGKTVKVFEDRFFMSLLAFFSLATNFLPLALNKASFSSCV